MNDLSCDAAAELLVDYSDGELAEAERRSVEAHLVRCPGCRDELRRLERSLECAKAVWQASAASATETCELDRHGSPDPAEMTDRRSPFDAGDLRSRGVRGQETRAQQVRVAVVLAACAAIVLVGLGTWFALCDRRQPASREQAAVSDPSETELAASKAGSSPDDFKIREIVSRETRAARLAAAAGFLATDPALHAYRSEAEKYLAEAYPEASAIRRPNRRISTPTDKGPKS
jgi:hypothetical protein